MRKYEVTLYGTRPATVEYTAVIKVEAENEDLAAEIAERSELNWTRDVVQVDEDRAELQGIRANQVDLIKKGTVSDLPIYDPHGPTPIPAFLSTPPMTSQVPLDLIRRILLRLENAHKGGKRRSEELHAELSTYLPASHPEGDQP